MSNRRPTRPTGQYDPFSSRPSQRMSPATSEAPQEWPSYDARGLDRRSLTTQDELSLQQNELQQQQQQLLGFAVAEPMSYSSREAPFRSATEETGASGRRLSQDSYGFYNETNLNQGYTEYDPDISTRTGFDTGRTDPRQPGRRRPYSQDEFDGPSQLLPPPLPQEDHVRAQPLPQQFISFSVEEQDEILGRLNDTLSQCAFHFVAKYQFPIPLERDKPRVRIPADRDWTEWAYLLKRLATKRRIPARVLFDNQIKQLVTILENSIVARQSTSSTRNEQPQQRSFKDDRYLLQLISSGVQVAKILLDSLAMQQLEELYSRTETAIFERRSRIRVEAFAY